MPAVFYLGIFVVVVYLYCWEMRCRHLSPSGVVTLYSGTKIGKLAVDDDVGIIFSKNWPGRFSRSLHFVVMVR